MSIPIKGGNKICSRNILLIKCVVKKCIMGRIQFLDHVRNVNQAVFMQNNKRVIEERLGLKQVEFEAELTTSKIVEALESNSGVCFRNIPDEQGCWVVRVFTQTGLYNEYAGTGI